MFKKLVFFLVFITLGWAQDPAILYLTWKGDPATTMTVMWHTTNGDGPSSVYYQHPGQSVWQKSGGVSKPLAKSSVTVYHAELTDLEPDTEYAFRLEDGDIHRFRTMPIGLDRPLHIAIGGDAYFSKELFQKMNREVASRDPDFVILAGDIVYAEGLSHAFSSYLWKVNRWEEFFEMWSKDMVAKDGRLIPIVPVLGNHDVKENHDNPFICDVLFFEFFVFPRKNIPYQMMKIGSDLCFYLLDSGHIFPIAGAQTEWLKASLEEHRGASYKIPVYHIGAYPSETSYTHRGAVDIRKFWVPIFEENGVKISMEHDSHTFKQTFPILQGMINPDGIIYLGDGAWGVFPRKPHRHWYLAKALQSNCYWLLTVDKNNCLVEAFDNEGKLLDELNIAPNRKPD